MPFQWTLNLEDWKMNGRFVKMNARYSLRGGLWDSLKAMRTKRQQRAWEKGGRHGPPHIMKQRMLLEHARAFDTHTLVETGTFVGEMVYAMKDHFKDIYTIELSRELHNRAKVAFQSYPHIHLVQGDSATALTSILSGITERCLFWLDGHYSGGITALGDKPSPVRAELEAIYQHPVKDHIILIDDANCFDGAGGYPTLFELYHTVARQFPGYEMQVFDNVIQIRPSAREAASRDENAYNFSRVLVQ